jgi:hypothetical protein
MSSDIPKARKLLQTKPLTRNTIRLALRLMHRARPKKIVSSKRVVAIGKRERRRIIELRAADYSVPDIAIIMGVNSRAVSHIINGK